VLGLRWSLPFSLAFGRISFYVKAVPVNYLH